MKKIIIGIDPGVKTGLAIWSTETKRFIRVETHNIISAMSEIVPLANAGLVKELHFEDARLRTWFGKTSREVLQGAGSIKRDCSIWQNFCEHFNINYKAIKPERGQTKWDSAYFKKVTKWDKRTSEHSRDAAVLVFGAK